ncbi:MAG TPA: S49 family peptidase, partial [Pirellulales bacterium]|nr:S49 family peptidase [Pirellulales bacterium]
MPIAKPLKLSRKYRHVAAAVYQTPWAITEEKFNTILDVLELRRQGQRITSEELRLLFGDEPDEDDDSLFAVTPSGIAIMRLQGVISQRMNLFMRISGGTSTELFGHAFDQVMADPEIKAVVLDTNSPGGSTGGVPELADKIYSARGRKPIIAVGNTLMASAAYWIGSAADQVIASPSAPIGSIGVLMVHSERSKQDAKLGLTRTVIRAGRFKALGNDAEPLNAETQGKLQEFVDSMYALFVEAVARNRKVSTAAVTGGMGQGDLALGRDAVSAGLADDVDTLEGVIAKLESRLKTSAVGKGFENNARAVTAAQSVSTPLTADKSSGAISPAQPGTPLTALKGVPAVNPKIKAHL